MMEKTNDGGPAFPLPLGNEDIDPSVSGMTLRDYFAAKAMQGMISAQVGNECMGKKIGVAGIAYEFADAMLFAREVQS